MPYIPHTPEEIREMLAVVGVSDMECQARHKILSGAIKPDLAAIDYRGVSLPTQKRETRIVKDTPVDVIAQEIIDWIAS